MAHDPAVLPFPPSPDATPPVSDVPRWCVRRFPTVGTDSLCLIGFDGNGYPKYAVTVPVDEDVTFWEAAIERRLATRAGKPLPPSVLPSRLTLLP